jgi:arginine utilization protein RocB
VSDWFERTRDLTLRLVAFPSVTDSHGERDFAPFLRDLLAEHPYFREHPQHLWLETTRADPRERSVLYALARGEGPETVILTGHYDVVSVSNYGPLAPLAFDPQRLLPALIAELRQSGRGTADTRALADLESGHFLPGRAALDMKSGLAAGIAVLERFAAGRERKGNLLFVAVPDEEGASHGMRTAASGLLEVAERWGLRLGAALNLDSAVDPGRGEAGQVVFTGSVGKLLPSVLFLGRPTHAGAPFDGVNANLLAAEFTRLVEVNLEFGDPGHEPAPPPISLYQSDLRTHYDVTTPASAWTAFNVLTHRRSLAEVLESGMEAARTAIENALELLRERAALYRQRSGEPVYLPEYRPEVLSFAQLERRALEKPGVGAEYAALSRQLAADPGLDLPTLSRQLTEFLARAAGLEGPAAVVGFAALYYPRAELNGSPRAQAVLEAVREAMGEVSREQGVRLALRPFFPGISDMSFLAGQDNPEALRALAENTPFWGTRLEFDYTQAARLELPTLNIGPWGRDYHQRTERVHMPYSFGVLPELLWRVVGKLLGGKL